MICIGHNGQLPSLGLALATLAYLSTTGCVKDVYDSARIADDEPITSLGLKDELRIPAGTTRAKFQHGTQVSAVNRFFDYCEFEVNEVLERPQTVRADRFTIAQIRHRVLSDDVTEVPLALGSSILGCSEEIYFETRYRLRSDEQPNARALICRAVTVNCIGYGFPGTARIQEILGPRFAWEVAAPRPPDVRQKSPKL